MAISRISQVPRIQEQGLLYYSMYLSLLYLSTPDEISNLCAKSRNKNKIPHLKMTSKHQHLQRQIAISILPCWCQSGTSYIPKEIKDKKKKKNSVFFQWLHLEKLSHCYMKTAEVKNY